MQALKTAIVLVLVSASGSAGAATLPGRLAESVGNDPKASTPECQAAQADAREWDEGQLGKVASRVGRIIIWPLGERRAQRKGDEKNAARELVTERLRQACFTQPIIERAETPRDQRWPGGRRYDKKLTFSVRTGGRKVAVLVHPTANALWVRSTSGGPGHAFWTPESFVGPVAWALEPTGCRVTADMPAAEDSREVGFVCPPGVDLRQLVLARGPKPQGQIVP